jgi:CheY-like chemotaxis protein
MSTTSCPASVLLVEDDHRLRGAIAGFLENRGYATVGAETMEDAMELLPSVVRPCLVLVDPMTTPPDWRGLFEALTPDDRVATLPMILVSVNAPDLLVRPVIIKRPIDFEILFRIAQDHCCGGNREPGKSSGGHDASRERNS